MNLKDLRKDIERNQEIVAGFKAKGRISGEELAQLKGTNYAGVKGRVLTALKALQPPEPPPPVMAAGDKVSEMVRGKGGIPRPTMGPTVGPHPMLESAGRPPGRGPVRTMGPGVGPSPRMESVGRPPRGSVPIMGPGIGPAPEPTIGPGAARAALATAKAASGANTAAKIASAAGVAPAATEGGVSGLYSALAGGAGGAAASGGMWSKAASLGGTVLNKAMPVMSAIALLSFIYSNTAGAHAEKQAERGAEGDYMSEGSTLDALLQQERGTSGFITRSNTVDARTAGMRERLGYIQDSALRDLAGNRADMLNTIGIKTAPSSDELLLALGMP